ncbi:MAG: FeoB-associated Cys-rich membrane protein [Clostridia bacterium]|nr:FeoB-associated Cys-rich membrane protein [Clostridia bacterium]
MENVVVVAILVLIVCCAIAYIVKAKKKGVKCVGCPYAETCGKENCSCNNSQNE